MYLGKVIAKFLLTMLYPLKFDHSAARHSLTTHTNRGLPPIKGKKRHCEKDDAAKLHRADDGRRSRGFHFPILNRRRRRLTRERKAERSARSATDGKASEL